ncbi:hypothetical protein IWX47DRAFT_185694 [Phyllosticta citricarpa]|uniref:Uncharacterized protein n=1 Tax=Phyllosticta citricarpa TaxID=55181 RepID=A0ABR1MLG6_9PEZI
MATFGRQSPGSAGNVEHCSIGSSCRRKHVLRDSHAADPPSVQACATLRGERTSLTHSTSLIIRRFFSVVSQPAGHAQILHLPTAKNIIVVTLRPAYICIQSSAVMHAVPASVSEPPPAPLRLATVRQTNTPTFEKQAASRQSRGAEGDVWCLVSPSACVWPCTSTHFPPPPQPQQFSVPLPSITTTPSPLPRPVPKPPPRPLQIPSYPILSCAALRCTALTNPYPTLPTYLSAPRKHDGSTTPHRHQTAAKSV